MAWNNNNKGGNCAKTTYKMDVSVSDGNPLKVDGVIWIKFDIKISLFNIMLWQYFHHRPSLWHLICGLPCYDIWSKFAVQIYWGGMWGVHLVTSFLLFHHRPSLWHLICGLPCPQSVSPDQCPSGPGAHNHIMIKIMIMIIITITQSGPGCT